MHQAVTMKDPAYATAIQRMVPTELSMDMGAALLKCAYPAFLEKGFGYAPALRPWPSSVPYQPLAGVIPQGCLC